MISSTPAVVWADSMVLGDQLLNWSSLMDSELVNCLAVGVDGNTKIFSSPWLAIPCNSWTLSFLHADHLKQLHQNFDFYLLVGRVCCSDGICLVPKSCYQR